jgi:hypothetical protein
MFFSMPILQLSRIRWWICSLKSALIMVDGRPQHAAFAKFRKRLLASSCLSVCLSVRMEKLGSHWTDFHEIRHLCIFRKSVEKNQVSLKYHNNNGTLHKDLCTFMIISRSVLFIMRNVSDKICRDNRNTHFTFNNFFLKIVPFVR